MVLFGCPLAGTKPNGRVLGVCRCRAGKRLSTARLVGSVGGLSDSSKTGDRPTEPAGDEPLPLSPHQAVPKPGQGPSPASPSPAKSPPATESPCQGRHGCRAERPGHLRMTAPSTATEAEGKSRSAQDSTIFLSQACSGCVSFGTSQSREMVNLGTGIGGRLIVSPATWENSLAV